MAVEGSQWIVPEATRRSDEQQSAITPAPLAPTLEQHTPGTAAHVQRAERVRLADRRSSPDHRWGQCQFARTSPAVPGTHRTPTALQIELGIEPLGETDTVGEQRQRFMSAIRTSLSARQRPIPDGCAEQYRQRDDQNQISREQQHALTTPDSALLLLSSVPRIQAYPAPMRPLRITVRPGPSLAPRRSPR